MRIALLAMTAFALAGCGDSAFKRRVQDAVRDQLVDPESARFTDDWYSEDGRIACGAVNARNRMGGYSGKQLWVWKDYRAQIMSDVLGSDFNQINSIWDECQRARFPEQFRSSNTASTNTANANTATAPSNSAADLERAAQQAMDEANQAMREAEAAMNRARQAR